MPSFDLSAKAALIRAGMPAGNAEEVAGFMGGAAVVDAGARYSNWGRSADAANLQAIINEAPAGSTVLLPRRLLLTSQVTSDKSLAGQGMGHYRRARPTDAATMVQVDSTTLSPFLLTGTGISATDFHVYNASSTTPTAGAAIVWQGTVDAAGASGVSIERVSSHGFYDGTVYMTGDATQYELRHLLATNFVRAGYVFNQSAFAGDNADGSTFNCQAIAWSGRTPLAGMLALGGGGQKHFGLKVNSEASGNGPKYGYAFFPKSGVETSVIMLVGSSFENLQGTGQGICFDVNPSKTGDQSSLAEFTFGGSIGGIQIGQCEIANYAGGSSAYAIKLQGASGNRIVGVSITGNGYVGGNSGVIHDYVDSLAMKANYHRGIGGDNPIHHVNGGHSRYVSTDYGTGDGVRTLWLNSSPGNLLGDGNIECPIFAWDLEALATSTQYLTTTQSLFSEVLFTLRFAGVAQGQGAVSFVEEWSVVQGASGAPTATKISGTYRNAGSSVVAGSCWAASSMAVGATGLAGPTINIANSATGLSGKLTVQLSGAVTRCVRNLP